MEPTDIIDTLIDNLATAMELADAREPMANRFAEKLVVEL